MPVLTHAKLRAENRVRSSYRRTENSDLTGYFFSGINPQSRKQHGVYGSSKQPVAMHQFTFLGRLASKRASHISWG